eukprot:sb/3466848/
MLHVLIKEELKTRASDLQRISYPEHFEERSRFWVTKKLRTVGKCKRVTLSDLSQGCSVVFLLFLAHFGEFVDDVQFETAVCLAPGLPFELRNISSSMNWMGGARNRMKDSEEGKRRKEFFERNRSRDIQLMGRRQSLDIVSMRTVSAANSNPRNSQSEYSTAMLTVNYNLTKMTSPDWLFTCYSRLLFSHCSKYIDLSTPIQGVLPPKPEQQKGSNAGGIRHQFVNMSPPQQSNTIAVESDANRCRGLVMKLPHHASAPVGNYIRREFVTNHLNLRARCPLCFISCSCSNCVSKVRFKRLERFLEIGALRVVFTKRDQRS